MSTLSNALKECGFSEKLVQSIEENTLFDADVCDYPIDEIIENKVISDNCSYTTDILVIQGKKD